MNTSSYLDNLSPENKEILETVISLIKEKYPLLQRALIYCEEISGEKPTVAFNNIRDFLSHLRTVFSRWDATPEDKRKQLAQAEEHLRRAIIEPYELASKVEIGKLEKTYERYIEAVPKLGHKMNPTPPTIQEIQSRLNLIYELREKGREAKSENNWTQVWEEGIGQFIKTIEIAQEWDGKLKTEIARADQIQRETQWFWEQIIGAVIIAAIFYALGYFWK